jgi:hypothetical protein
MKRWIVCVCGAGLAAALAVTQGGCARFAERASAESPDQYGSTTSPLYDPYASPPSYPGRPTFPPHTEGP